MIILQKKKHKLEIKIILLNKLMNYFQKLKLFRNIIFFLFSEIVSYKKLIMKI